MTKNALERNISIHDRIARKYESIHGEIYNDIEQSRLKSKLALALSKVSTGSEHLLALDFGCGAGNLTQHLTDLGCDVLAADVSSGFLDLVSSKAYKKEVRTHKLNGKDLEGIENESLDVVAMYSVLHHVSDYLSLLKEFARVLKKGGVLYIDHEASSAFWEKNEFPVFKQEMKKGAKKDIAKFFIINNYIDRLIRMLFDPRYQREGDIHVFHDDHIEWDKIRHELKVNGVMVLFEEDYLLYRKNYDKAIFEKWKTKVGDMHCLVAGKE